MTDNIDNFFAEDNESRCLAEISAGSSVKNVEGQGIRGAHFL
jgi:hypothetical protein